MKKFFEKIKNYSFWVSLSGGVILFLNALSNAFGFKIQNEVVEDCIMSFASLLTVFGIVSMKQTQTEEIADESDQDKTTDDE